jgi:uncharacterized membrane protein (UPF0127 family)
MLNYKYIIGVTLLVLAVSAIAWDVEGRDQSAWGRPHFQHTNFVITRSDQSSFSFSSEIADSPQEQAYGLMFIHSLPKDAGMIFPYDPPREIAFWMKDTLIPLDMLFIRPDHTIGRIVANAVPEDVTPIPSLEPVSAVIEINGGLAEKEGIKVGDKVSSPIFH